MQQPNIQVPQADHANLKDFEQFMTAQTGWVLVNKTDNLLSYQKNVAERKASCLIAAILLLLFAIPGIIYLYFGHKPGKTYRLTVTKDDFGTLSASGDKEGMVLYNNYLFRLNQWSRTA